MPGDSPSDDPARSESTSPGPGRPAAPQHPGIGPSAAVGGGVVAVLVAVLFGQGNGVHAVVYFIALLAAFNGVRTVLAGRSDRPWLNRLAGSLAVLLAVIAAALVYVGVHDLASWF